MSNRVDELESEIAELRAAVNGLTEELVETKARVRKLEDAAEADEAPPATETTVSDDHVEVVEQNDDAETAEADPDAAASEEDNPSESTETTDDEAEQGDIIVA